MQLLVHNHICMYMIIYVRVLIWLNKYALSHARRPIAQMLLHYIHFTYVTNYGEIPGKADF